MVKLRDIAEAANVSVPLVSKVLNNRLGSTGASEQTIKTIRRIARQMGYRRNEAAAALRTGRQQVVGVVIHKLGAAASGLLEALLEGVSVECNNAGLRQELTFYTDPSRISDYLDRVQPSRLDGLILGGVMDVELLPQLLAIQQRGVPVVTVYGRELGQGIPNAGCDDAEIARMATEHLLSTGCSRIAHLCGMPQRDAGYRRALDQAGLAVDEALAIDSQGFDHARGMAAVDALIGKGIELDGIFADSDQLAMGAMRALRQHGRDVPGDVKVVGVDDSPFCECTVVSLSSVSGCDRKRGAIAVQMLRDIRDRKTVASRDVEPELHVRASSK